MAQLTPQQRQDRLRLDYRVAMEMSCPVMSVTAYRNADDLEARRNPVVSQEEGHLATHYVAVYHMSTLIGADRFSNKTAVKFDLLASGKYPFLPPACFVVSSPFPWTPHFRQGLPICTDSERWVEMKGKLLLGHWLVHVAKLLNFDEVPRSADYGGYTPEAASYWRTTLNQRPITPNFSYPVLPTWLNVKPVSAFGPAEDFFEALPSGGEFEAVSGPAPPDTDFAPAAAETDADVFSPR